jgi:hypothetical protein
MYGAYDYLSRTPSEYVAEARARGERGPVGAGPTVGARTPQGRAAEAGFGMGKREGGEVPWLWIGAGVLAVILIARR